MLYYYGTAQLQSNKAPEIHTSHLQVTLVLLALNYFIHAVVELTYNSKFFIIKIVYCLFYT